ncbi:MAG: response regulator transcription factor [Candidatus Manganitrophus sp.]|nr:response regulator transcription factor [Candidatus Manganitrophus sp.]
MIKIFIADDHAIVRRGLKQILTETSDMVVAGEAHNGQELLEKMRSDQWDVVVLDISMPGRGGLDILKQLKSEQPKLPVLMLTIHPEDQYAVRVLRAGASGYLTKESAPDHLVEAIRKVARGGNISALIWRRSLPLTWSPFPSGRFTRRSPTANFRSSVSSPPEKRSRTSERSSP